MSQQGIEKFFRIARERHQIFLDRAAGKRKPWSKDPIFQKEYFCNVFREYDKTTLWFRTNIRDKVKDDPERALFAIMAFRWFNKIKTGEKIKEQLLQSPDKWNKDEIYEILKNERPIVTGAYIIKTPDKMTKLEGVLWCIDKFLWNAQIGMFDKILEGKATMQEACALLQQSPYLGGFMAWQICSDARFTCLLKKAPDCHTWARPGPGSARGLGRTFYNDVDKFNANSPSDIKQMLELMQTLMLMSDDGKYWPHEWPVWSVADVQHWACEVDKYSRAEEGGKMKRKYNAA